MKSRMPAFKVFFSKPGLPLTLDSKTSLFCSKICGTNKKVKSTRYASHFVYTGARTTPGLQLSYCAAIFALLYSFWSKRETAPGLPYSPKTKVSFPRGYQVLLEYSSARTP